MKTIRAIALGAAAVALAGAAAAAAPSKTHNMDVPLPDGSVAHISYVGNVAPKVSIDPRPLAYGQDDWGMPFPSFAGFDRMIQEMNQRTQQMMRQAQQMSAHPGVAAPYIASYSNLPAGQTSTTVVSVSNGGATCTRSTEVVSQGVGKPPKVTSSVSGQCGPAAARQQGPVTRT
ncbi:MAG TPA: hypothetical protein VFW39_11305 [Sphingomicrobium sp.]|nr:hypothetical protein [Sphingomicrobium sp.]